MHDENRDIEWIHVVQTKSDLAAMNSDEYILYDDDVGALVFDPGHHSLRVGYAHEASPMAAIPAWVGVVSDDTNTKAATSNGMNIDSKPNNNNVTYST